VEIITALQNGTLDVNSTPSTLFNGSPLNVTLAPGTYDFALYQGTILFGHQNATILPGGYILLFIAAGAVTTVSFNETGLPVGKTWSVSLGSQTASGSSHVLRFHVLNATYPYRVGFLSGYHPSPTSGILYVNGTNFSVSIVFTLVTYTLT